MSHDTPAGTIPPELAIPSTDGLRALQDHTRKVCARLGWDAASDEKTFLLFIEEVGELAKAIRKTERLFEEDAKHHGDDAARRANLEEEFSHVLSYLIDLATRYGVDLAAGYEANITSIFKRSWK